MNRKNAQNALQSVAYLILAQPYISLQVNSILQEISLYVNISENGGHMFSVVYHPEAREEATALPLKIRVKFDRLIGKLEYDARLLREPDTKPLGDGLFEIRTMGTDIARGIWVYHKGNTIIMLRVFIKKSQKTPAKEIDLARKRLAEVLNETGKP